jgi:Mg2+-importing ATPase
MYQLALDGAGQLIAGRRQGGAGPGAGAAADWTAVRDSASVRLAMHAGLPKRLLSGLRPGAGHGGGGIRVAPLLLESAGLDTAAVFARLDTAPAGLTSEQAAARLAEHGPNVLAQDERPSLARLLWRAVLNPLVLLLTVLATVSFVTGDPHAGSVMALMIALSVGLKWFQEAKAGSSAAKLKAMIAVHATVLRDGAPSEIPLAKLVPGDVVQLAAGDMIPADVRIVQAKDLFVVQGSLTGESFPVEKRSTAVAPLAPAPGPGAGAGAPTGATAAPPPPVAAAANAEPPPSAPGSTHAGVSSPPAPAPAPAPSPAPTPFEQSTLAFLGTSVESGSASAVVVATGHDSYLGGMAASLTEQGTETAFDRDISRFTWLLLRFMLVMVPLVFVINGLTKGSWGQAFFFALAVAVGLTPEMLPMIVTVCLSKGAVAMGKKKVIVKRLNAIQNLGAMDVLCTDKTGTLTLDKVMLERHCDVALRENDGVLALAYSNSHFQTGLKNVLDRAVLAHEEAHARARIAGVSKVDEIPFDFQRRIMSVVVRTPDGQDLIISKGAPEAIFPRCDRFELDGKLEPMDHAHIGALEGEYQRLSADGFRVLAIATKVCAPRGAVSAGPVPPALDALGTPYGKADECGLVLQGYVAFLDPPKDSCSAAIQALQGHGVAVKVITGDNDLVARKVCREVGLALEGVHLGAEVEAMSDAELAAAAETTTLFARVSPAHKQRIIEALKSRGHTVGFMGDGINDAPALHAADVGISVDSAVDIAKASADMILLEKSLLVVDEGVLEGRKVFANITKYVRMGASSNFGNMFSVLGASVFVPFLPMLPIQILTNNLLYDLGQTTIPTDRVDPDQIRTPRPWDMRSLTRFIVFIGPCSSLFDYSTYLVMLYVFGCRDTTSSAMAAAHSARLFQTGWFVESLVTQALVIHVIRTNRIPFLESRASGPVLAMGLATLAVGIGLTWSPVGAALGFTVLPGLYWPILALTVACYLLLTQAVKTALLRRGWI